MRSDRGQSTDQLKKIRALTAWNAFALLKHNMTYYLNARGAPWTGPTLKTHSGHGCMTRSLPSACLLSSPPAWMKDGGGERGGSLRAKQAVREVETRLQIKVQLSASTGAVTGRPFFKIVLLSTALTVSFCGKGGPAWCFGWLGKIKSVHTSLGGALNMTFSILFFTELVFGINSDVFLVLGRACKLLKSPQEKKY